MRHGQARSNVEERLDSGNDAENHLTDYGREGVLATAKEMKGKRTIDLIVTSPLVRTRETAALMQKEFGLPDSAVMVDERLRERKVGIYDGKLIVEWGQLFYVAWRPV